MHFPLSETSVRKDGGPWELDLRLSSVRESDSWRTINVRANDTRTYLRRPPPLTLA